MCLLVVLGLAVVLTFSAGQHGLTTRPAGAGGGPCSVVEQIRLAADIAVPLVGTGGRQRCEITTASAPGQWHLAVAHLLQVLGWAFATLFVAGYTGIVRKA
ncbi:hypothetical protein LX15_002563 [Streptoalloteichus tenebrarius]|uniref:Uncharacterized protein n=1 Tax=Streptoalloteichus tenebrarius (strain ATCC 17920 / DSM 40477 / JCM 4838 / CBS 697.72 / NBRC 16177 / NCIMB 11028 / NRRL B-12390 / A12253. 1 / ISP 5477) TaxID=1933 RepID=A0ABT1HTM3_STRSD|nr:hypothetical protein [Streptoalloteichus tenebrarius]BFE99451.1 hypothetical protein GCM10020241_11270 [Streptoalloteichus tenebrarius]